MLLRFRVSNFRSIKDEQELSMVASSLAGPSESLVHLESEGLDVLRAAAIYGANAAGKSNVLDALQFMATAVRESHHGWRPEGPIPREPFLLDAAGPVLPSRFEIDFLLGRTRLRYGFELDSERVLKEWLYAYPHRREQVWYRRDTDRAEPFHFGKSLRGNNRTVASLTRSNSLFLSAAAENNHELLSRVHSWFATHLVFCSRDTLPPRLLPGRAALLAGLVRLADFGISDINDRGEKSPEVQSKISDSLAIMRSVEYDISEYFHPSRLRFGGLRHSSPDHPSGVSLPFQNESQGTRAWLSLADSLLDALETGGVLCVDELDRSLHPRLALEVVRIFDDPARNPMKAQLIFNTHDTSLLGNLFGGPALRRDQIWFVEKDAAGVSHLYPLTDFSPRRDENLERGYLQGRYGAIPFVGPVPFSAAEDA
jgi:hypothetical protein